MAKRLIDGIKFRQRLIDRQITTQFFNQREREEIGHIIEMLDDQPTVDAVEVVHGRWKPDLYHDGQPYRDEWYGYIFKCSVCGDTTMGSYDLECHYNYRPNCGAKMDGERRTDAGV